jgi:hypothetical protein
VHKGNDIFIKVEATRKNGTNLFKKGEVKAENLNGRILLVEN